LFFFKYYRYLNENPLYGKTPNLSNNENLSSCYFSQTNLCYVKEEKNPECYGYSETVVDCSECADNASLIDNVCQCNSGYYGLGYIYCNKKNTDGKYIYKYIIYIYF